MNDYEFYVNDKGTWFGVLKEGDYYVCVQQGASRPYETTYPVNSDPNNWINAVPRHDKITTLTAEQQKQLKDFKEQVEQLEQSIKLNQQDICHRERLVANYEQRKKDVLDKIAELEGV